MPASTRPGGRHVAQRKACRLVVDPSDTVLDDPTGLGVDEARFVIHGCVHEARPEINCALHTHTRAGVAVSAQKCGLPPLSQHAMRGSTARA